MRAADVLFQGTYAPVSLPVCDHYAGSEKLMRKSLALQHQRGPVFDITFDCEDGAAAGREADHARLVGELIASSENVHGRVGARVHDPSSPHFAQDVDIICRIAASRLAYLVVPKVDNLSELRQALAAIGQASQAAGRAHLPVHVLIETHGALHEIWQIASLPAVECLSFGIMDFVSAHHGAIPAAAMRSPGQFEHPLVTRAKVEIAAACHAHGKVASHNVCTDIRDLSVVAADARMASQTFGYSRMWSIHPDQIDPIVAAFTPSLAELEDALTILCAAQACDWGPIQHQGTLHDRASYRYYWCLLQRAKNSGHPLPERASALM